MARQSRVCVRVAVFLCVVAAAAPAMASEGAVAGGPIGGTDIRTAYLPEKPGFYMTTLAFYSTASGLYGHDGVKTASADLSFKNLAVSLTYVYPFKLAGGTLATTIQDYYLTGPIRIGSVEHHESSFGDLYADLLSWSKRIAPLSVPGAHNPALPYGLTARLSYAMILPVGHYDRTKIFTSGHNTTYYIPNLGLSYLTKPNAIGDGLEFSARAFFDIAARNRKTDYRSGTILDVDFAVTERRGRGQFGLVGYYATQFEDDVKAGQRIEPDGRHLRQFYLGPVGAVDVPAIKGTVKAKILVPVDIQYGLNATRYMLYYSTRL